MCARSMHKAVEALARDFCGQTGHDIAFTFGTVGGLQAKLAAGETADVLILGTPAVDKLEREGALATGTRKDVARTFVAVCIRASAPAPDIATPEAFERTLREARAHRHERRRRQAASGARSHGQGTGRDAALRSRVAVGARL